MSESTRPAKPEADDEIDIPRGSGPAKTARSTFRRAIRGKTLKKPAVAASKAAAKTVAKTGGRSPRDRSDQRERRPRRAEGYVRFTVQRDGEGDLKVVDGHWVDGALAPTTFFGAAHAYDVALDGKRLHAGALPDLGVRRAFAPPGPAGERVGHHLTELPACEFDVRVPTEGLTAAMLRNITIRLLRVKGQPDHHLTSAVALDQHLETHMREIGRVSGISAAAIPTEMKPGGKR